MANRSVRFKRDHTAEMHWDEDDELILRPNVSYKKCFRLSDPEGYIAPLDQGLDALDFIFFKFLVCTSKPTNNGRVRRELVGSKVST